MTDHCPTPACVRRRPAWVGAALLLTIGFVGVPSLASAQQTAFVQAIFDLTGALEGTYGDEGPSVRPAIDRMSAALTQWDREIETAAAGVRSARPDATSIDRRVSLARMYADRGRFAAALSELDAASTLQPQRADVLVLRGLVLDASGKPREAVEAFRAAQSADPGNAVTAYYLFHEASITGDTEEARHAASVLGAAYPPLIAALEKARPPSSGRKQTPFARIGPLQSAAAGPPVVPLAAYSPAFRLLVRRDYEKAIEEFRTAAASDPMIADPAAGSPAMLGAVAFLKRGRFEEARAQIEQAGNLAGSSEAQRVLGLIYWADAAYEKSIAALKEAVRRSPRNERARLALSRVLSTAGRDDEATGALQETFSALPESVLGHWWLASLHERVNRFADARVEYQRAAAAAISGESQLYGAVGRLASGAADLPGAIDAFARAVSASPNDAAMHRSLADALMQNDRADEALAEFIAAVLIDPRDAEALAGIGQVHLNSGRVAEAVNVLRLATDIAPTRNEARYTLATALARLGRTEEAAQQFARVEREQRQIIADSRRTLSHDVLKEEAALRAAEGRLEVAITLYEKALEVSSDPDVYRRLADLYARVGRSSDAARARAMYEKARQSGKPENAR